MMQTLTKPAQWDASSSILNMDFESKPLLNDISIVIPTLGRPILEQAIYWILIGNAWPSCLIVVEQGSNGDVVRWLQRVEDLGIRVKHIVSGQRGRSAGINRGLEQTDTQFVAITDDDCFVSEEWLMKMTAKLRLSPEAVITGQVEAAGDDMIVVVDSKIPFARSRPTLKFDSMSGGNMGTSLEVFRKVGLFEEDPVMGTAEDAEWAYRALRRGVTIRYEPDVILAHFGWRDQSKRIEQYRHYALSHGGFYGKYLRRGDVFILVRVAIHVGRALRWWFKGALSGNAELALLGKSYCLNLFPGIWSGIRSKIGPAQLEHGEDK